MSAPLLALAIAGGLVGYWTAARVGALGLWRLGGEGDDMAHTDKLDRENSGAAPSPRKRLFMVGGRRRVRLAPFGFRVEQPRADAGVPMVKEAS